MNPTLTLLTALLLTPLAALRANIYHVDSIAGNDANGGGNPDEAWRSFEKVNATTFQPGDKSLLKAGATWTGQLRPKGSGNAAIYSSSGLTPYPVTHSQTHQPCKPTFQILIRSSCA